MPEVSELSEKEKRHSIAVALTGQSLGLEKATMIMHVAAGLAAFVFGLIGLKLIKFKIADSVLQTICLGRTPVSVSIISGI